MKYELIVSFVKMENSSQSDLMPFQFEHRNALIARSKICQRIIVVKCGKREKYKVLGFVKSDQSTPAHFQNT